MFLLFVQKLNRLKPLWQVLSPRRRQQLIGLQILSVFAALGEVANLGSLLPFLRLLANPTEGLRSFGALAVPLTSLPQQHLLFVLGLCFVVVVVTSTLLRVLTIRTQLRLSSLIASDIGEQVFASVLHKPFAWHLQHNTSSVLGHLTKDVDQVAGSIRNLLIVVVNLAIVVLLGASLIALVPGVMLLISPLLAGFYVLVFRFTRGTLRTDGERYTISYQASLQVAQEGLGGIRDVILDRSQLFFIDAYRFRNRNYQLAGAAINIKTQVPRYLIEGFLMILVVGLSLSLALSGQGIERQLPILGILSLGTYRLLQPLQQCFSSISSLQANQASLQRLLPFLQPQDNSKQLEQSFSLPISSERGNPLLQLSQVSFQYANMAPEVIRELDLTVHSGERIAFVGSTGSGKSTTSDLILGLLAPTKGKLYVHGHDLHNTPGLVACWQTRVAHVPQQIYLSDASFAANIAFGVPAEHIDHHRVRQAAEQAKIIELIESSPEGYATMVGERGVRLSGGQRQRIGIARALYRRAELLVLDEATSALDNRTEAEVMAAIDGLDRTITVLLIAHRLSTVQRCDRIVLLEAGMIVGLGSYQELESTNATFQLLARHRDQIT